MNKILLLAFSILFFGCDSSTRTSETTTNNSQSNPTSESVKEDAGTEISPQLKGVQDSANRLTVDTISSASETK